MTKYILPIVFLLFGLNAFSQSTAPNWTHMDCNSTNHTLYNYLDSQEVVVMQFVMGCSSCTDAGTLLMSLKNEYDVSHPGKVNFFLMDYFPSNTCTEVNATWNTYNFDAYFSGCWAEKEVYYPTLYPMPAFVIAAGNYHTVIYNDISWQNSDTTLMKQAIDQFFVTVGLEENGDDSFLIYPNPAKDMLYANITNFNTAVLSIAIYDMLGKKIDGVNYQMDKDILAIAITDLVKGNYVLELSSPQKTVRKMFVKD